MAVPFAFFATALRAPRYALLSGLAVAGTLVFNAAYRNADIGRYDLGPLLLIWTWLAVLATAVVDAIVDRVHGPVRDDLRAPAVRALAIIAAGALLIPTLIELPARHRVVDRSTDRGAQVWLDHAFEVIEPHAVVVSWWSYSTPLWYGQLIEGRRTDITVIDDRTRLDEHLGEVDDVIDAHLGRVPVYVMRAFPDELAEVEARYVLEYLPGTDSLFRVVGRVEDAR
jgi:hypothetical protein